MTANDDLLKGLVSSPPVYTTGSGSTGVRPYFGIDPTLKNDGKQYAYREGHWSTETVDRSTALTNEAYRESFKGQLETLTQIVSDNADYLINQIQIEIGPKDTHVYIPIGKTHGVPPKFTFPGGEINHSISKKYMDWLAMVQLILQDG